ncbi:hypothetical protein SAMN02745121_04583 [Nannocystis exedens]|uniref:Tetratricopeptide repeat-containing protein n=1 Tax=Nannocystis exedens TaxID=54 RepID=A0A1I2BBA4_9BACT|nr:hypothetical protein [Nannocystis exedens]PCC68074.1 hypothetical protein NAEX_01082 [Nannocystis exedens]SFE53454.1 hypothetical protein SAMN02745121_04583 [Nannocystis exedens]
MTTGPRGGEGELDPQAAAALRAFRAEEDMPAAAQARVWARLAASARAEETWSKRHVRRGMSEWTWAAVVVAAAAAVLLASRAGVLGPLVGSRDSGEAAAYVERQTAATEPVRAGEGPGERVGEDVVRETDAAPAATPLVEDGGPKEHVEKDMAQGTGESAGPPRGREPARGPERRGERPGAREAGSTAKGGASAAGAEGSSLAKEAELLGRAQAAIQLGEADEALALLAAYAQQFPRGALREEHDALRALALCASDRAGEGRAAAQVFLRAHGGSALAERVRQGCAEE